MSSELFLLFLGYSALGSVYNFFATIGHYISGGLTSLYNLTLGNLLGQFGSDTLSSLELTAIDAEAAILSFMSYLGNDIGSVFSGLFTSIMDFAISPALGVFGPMIAIVMLLGLLVAVIIGVRLLIDIL